MKTLDICVSDEKENHHLSSTIMKTRSQTRKQAHLNEKNIKCQENNRKRSSSDLNGDINHDKHTEKQKNTRKERIYECYTDEHGYLHTRAYIKGRFLGKGGFAKCYEMECETTKNIYAAKVVEKNSLTKSKAQQKFKSEINIHKNLNHPQIVQFEHFFEDSQHSYILLELCRNQSLSNLLRRRKQLTEDEVRFYLGQLIQGLIYLHSNLIIHRDLKLGNLFLTSGMELKIGDFGLATKLSNIHERKRTICGTPNYIAPEILDREKANGHSFEVDIWSAGVVMYTLLVGRPPFETKKVEETYKRIKNCLYTFPSTISLSKNAKSLIQNILQINPADRPSLTEILEHEFFKQGYNPTGLPQASLWITPQVTKGAVSAENPIQQHNEEKHGKKKPNCNIDIEMMESRPSSPARSHKSGKVRMTNGEPEIEPMEVDEQHPSQTENLEEKALNHSTSMSKNEPHFASNNASPIVDSLACACENLEKLFSLAMASEQPNLDEFSTASDIVTAAKRVILMQTEENDMQLQSTIKPARLWISQWVDYSSKYGMGYVLSNGSTGVYFNDSTKIITNHDGNNFDYIMRGDNPQDNNQPRQRCSFKKYDSALTKKVTLLIHFKSYLNEGRVENEEVDRLERLLRNVGPNSNDESKELIYVRKYVKTRHAVLFCLSNDSLQINFYDSTKLVLTNYGRVVTYVDKVGELLVFLTSGIILKNERSDLLRRLRYSKDMLQHIVSSTGGTQSSDSK